MTNKISIACCATLIISLFQMKLLFGQIFISKADTSCVYGFEVASIATSPILLAKMFTFSDAFSVNNLDPTKIATIRQPIQKLFIHKADAFLTNEFVSTSADHPLIKSVTPNVFSLFQNYPNPFNPTTTIRFDLPKQTLVTLKVYDIVGREVVTLVNEDLQPGEYKVDFNANGFSSGFYFYQIRAGDFVATKRMLLLK